MNAWKRSMVGVTVLLGAFVAGYAGIEVAQDRQFALAQAQVEDGRNKLSTAADLSGAFKDVGRVVEPSVVNINVKKVVKAPGGQGSPLDELRKRFHELNPDQELPDMPGMPDSPDGGMEQIGTGSGVIMEVVDGKAYILTNNHVAGGAEEMLITLSDGRQIENGRLLGADARSDLAVVEVKADRLIAAKWGDSDSVQQGDWIVAFGSPFGYVGSMTHGIVSALHRQAGLLGSQGYENFIQVDAPINPGNSGGPLVNLRGEVVGINTAIASRSGGFQGIGFAIPSNQAKFVYQQLKEKGKVIRGWLGVSISDVSRDRAKAEGFGYKSDKGVFVEQTFPDTPAFGTLKPGDIITEVNGKPADDTQSLRNLIAAMPPGTEVKMEVFRDEKTQPVTVKLGEQPADIESLAGAGGGRERGQTPGETSLSTLGVRVQTVTPDLADKLSLGNIKSGAVVTNVQRNSPADRAMLRPGDVITGIGTNRKPIKSASDLADALKGRDLTKDGVMLYVSGPEGSRFVMVRPAPAENNKPGQR